MCVRIVEVALEWGRGVGRGWGEGPGKVAQRQRVQGWSPTSSSVTGGFKGLLGAMQKLSYLAHHIRCSGRYCCCG